MARVLMSVAEASLGLFAGTGRGIGPNARLLLLDGVLSMKPTSRGGRPTTDERDYATTEMFVKGCGAAPAVFEALDGLVLGKYAVGEGKRGWHSLTASDEGAIEFTEAPAPVEGEAPAADERTPEQKKADANLKRAATRAKNKALKAAAEAPKA